MLKREDSARKYILVDDLTPEDNAAFQMLYARSAAGAEKILIEVYAARRTRVRQMILDTYPAMDSDEAEFGVEPLIAAAHDETSARAKRLMSNWFVGYGHRSIGDCGSTTLCVEGCSMLAAKAIQDWPLYSGQETSTRAINMSQQRIEDPIGTPESKAILDRWMAFYTDAQAPTEAEVRRRYPRQTGKRCQTCAGCGWVLKDEAPYDRKSCDGCEGRKLVGAEDEKAYEGAVKYRVFDILRAFLPAGATTNVSWHTNLRQVGDHLTWMLHHPLAEVRLIAREWQAMLRERYPNSGSFGGAAGLSGVGADGQDDERAVWYAEVAKEFTYPSLVGAYFDPYPEVFGLPSLFSKVDGLRIPDDVAEALHTRPRGCVLPHWMSDFGQVSFGFNLDFGSFRDLQRHRNGVCRMPVLTSYRGFEPWYLEQLPADLRAAAKQLIAEQSRVIHTKFEHSDRELDAQYLCAMGYRVACNVTMGLPAFVYLVELRSTKSVHPTLRTVVHQMITDFQAAHPEVPLHVDMTPDPWNVRRGTQTIERREEL